MIAKTSFSALPLRSASVLQNFMLLHHWASPQSQTSYNRSKVYIVHTCVKSTRKASSVQALKNLIVRAREKSQSAVQLFIYKKMEFSVIRISLLLKLILLAKTGLSSSNGNKVDILSTTPSLIVRYRSEKLLWESLFVRDRSLAGPSGNSARNISSKWYVRRATRLYQKYSHIWAEHPRHAHQFLPVLQR